MPVQTTRLGKLTARVWHHQTVLDDCIGRLLDALETDRVEDCDWRYIGRQLAGADERMRMLRDELIQFKEAYCRDIPGQQHLFPEASQE